VPVTCQQCTTWEEHIRVRQGNHAIGGRHHRGRRKVFTLQTLADSSCKCNA